MREIRFDEALYPYTYTGGASRARQEQSYRHEVVNTLYYDQRKNSMTEVAPTCLPVDGFDYFDRLKCSSSGRSSSNSYSTMENEKRHQRETIRPPSAFIHYSL